MKNSVEICELGSEFETADLLNTNWVC